VAIENALGVKYLSGAVEDHTNRPFDSLEEYALGSPARTFPRRTLQAMLGEAGFTAEFLAAFPDYKLPRAVMSDELFHSSSQLAENLPRFPSPDYLVPRLQLADERLTWRTLLAAGVAEHFANSFIALARKGGGPSLWSAERQAVFFASDRQPEFAVRADVRADDDGLVLVRTPLHPDRQGGNEDPSIRHAPPASERVIAGRELVQVLIDEPGRRGDLMRRWAELVPDAEWAPVDLVPHNVVLTDDDRLVVFDQEWTVRGYDRQSLLVRGLFHTALQLASRTRPERLAPFGTVAELVSALGAEIGVGVDKESIERFCIHEARFQSLVNTTDALREDRATRATADLRNAFAMELKDVRGGDRFDVQWERAKRDIDHLNSLLREREEVRRELEAKLTEYVKAQEEAVQEIAGLRARRPTAIARRVAKQIAVRTGVRNRR
jgi:hypothetical protein